MQLVGNFFIGILSLGPIKARIGPKKIKIQAKIA